MQSLKTLKILLGKKKIPQRVPRPEGPILDVLTLRSYYIEPFGNYLERQLGYLPLK